jgi:hypothetical protein
MCTFEVVSRALALGQFNASGGSNTWSGTATWTFAQIPNSNIANCDTFRNNWGEFTGVLLTATLNQTSTGPGGGVTGHMLNITPGQTCSASFPILCCR